MIERHILEEEVMKKRFLFSAAVILVFSATAVLAGPTIDNFSISLDDGEIYAGSGSGYNDGTGEYDTPWYYYENTDWYNQWFYDDPPDPTPAGVSLTSMPRQSGSPSSRRSWPPFPCTGKAPK